MGKDSGEDIGLLVLGGLALLSLGGQDKGQNGGGGDGKRGVFPSGQINTVSVSRQATMGSHKLKKEYGSDIFVQVKWTAGTKDKAGNPIEWPYRLRAKLGHNTLGGWKLAEELGKAGVGTSELVLSFTLTWLKGPQDSWFQFGAPSQDENQEWDIRVSLEAKTSDAQGKPTDTWTAVAKGEHVGAIVTVPVPAKDLTASPWGSVDTVDVWQDRLGAGQW